MNVLFFLCFSPHFFFSFQVGNLGLLFMLLFFIFAALGVELFGDLGESSSASGRGGNGVGVGRGSHSCAWSYRVWWYTPLRGAGTACHIQELWDGLPDPIPSIHRRQLERDNEGECWVFVSKCIAVKFAKSSVFFLKEQPIADCGSWRNLFTSLHLLVSLFSW